MSVGQEVRQRLTEEVGEVIALERFAPHTCRVRAAFPSGEEELLCKQVEPIWEPFGFLASPDGPVAPYDGWLRRERSFLLDAHRNDPISGLSNSRVELQHHQISVALRALQKPRPRLILADEVGLGKTIEAGLILKELRARERDLLERVLVVVPASLVTQWGFELRSKFNERFVFHDAAKLRELADRYPGQNPWAIEPNVICSLQLARRAEHRDQLAEASWDLVIVDEAHHARCHWDTEPRPNEGYRLIDALKNRVRGLLLLTATPMQLNDYELYAMIELVEPGLFLGYGDFSSSRGEIADTNRAVETLRKAKPTSGELDEARTVLAKYGAPARLRSALDESSVRSKARAWIEEQHRLSYALVRNRKAEIGGFKQRFAQRVPVIPTAEEVELERDIRAYIRRRHMEAVESGNTGLGLVLCVFQKMLCSSTRAVAGALETRAQRLLREAANESLTDDVELKEEMRAALDATTADTALEVSVLENLTRRARGIEDAKLDALERLVAGILGQPDEKVLIFSQYLATLEMIRERLSRRFSVRVFHGEMSREDKDDAHRAFKKEVQVLISSEAGGEGRNFQFCHVVVNYDLPWNPMKIEQRIGRVDRVGQTRDVLIYNFSVSGLLDERVLDVLENRIRVFTESVGGLDPILGEVEEGIAKVVLEEESRTNEGFERLDEELAEKVERAKRVDEMRRDFVLDWRSFRHDEVNILLGQRPKATLRDLERFVRFALGRFPTARLNEDGDRVLRIQVPGVVHQMNRELRDEYRGTFDVQTALADEALDLFAFGHPLVETLVDLTGDPCWPPVAVLETPEHAGDPLSLLVDYRLELYGVRDSGVLISHVVDANGVRPPPQLELPVDPRCELVLDAADGELVQRLRSASFEAAQGEALGLFGSFESENARLADEELGRIANTYAAQRGTLLERLERNRAQVARLEREGTEAQRSIVRAIRGQIVVDERRLSLIDEDEERDLADLRAKRHPTRYLRLLGVTILVPPGGLARLAERNAA